MAKYKLLDDGVLNTLTNESIPNSPGNRHWIEYQEWLDEGNTPDPQFSQEDIDSKVVRDEIVQLKGDLGKSLAWQFRMILELFQVGKEKGIWSDADFSQDIRDKAIQWKIKVDRLIELGE